ncbi:MAG: hypothetical protein ACPG4W_07275 [Flavobacteriales bacterium]
MTLDPYWLILIIILAAFALLYFMLKQVLDKQEANRHFELRRANQNISLPLRLQAYERLALFLERIHPQSLIVRLSPDSNTDVRTYMLLLQQQVQQEYEHNLSQQIYISQQVWESVLAAKNQVILEINASAKALNPNAKALLLFDSLQEKINEDHEEFVAWVCDMALLSIQKEVGRLC